MRIEAEEMSEDKIWKQYKGDFNSLSDKEIEEECEIARRQLEEAESWLEAVASWEKAGKPRNED
jgi:hypothetical protein